MPGDEIGRHPRRRSTATNHQRNILGNQIRKHVPQVVVHDDAPRAHHLRTVGTTMLVDVFENRKAERDDLFECVADTGPAVNRAQHLVNAAFEKVLLVAEMRVEGGPSDVGAVEDLFYGNRIVWLFAGEADQRGAQ